MNFVRKTLLTGVLSTLQAIAPFAAATPTDLADVPMAVKNSVTPNVMFTLDDSGSMQFEVIPESDKVFLTFPRPSTLYGSTYYAYGTFDQIPTFDIANAYARCYRNAQCNSLYYNPAKLYKPWLNYDGSSFPLAVATAACNNPNQCSGGSSEGTLNLTINQTYTRNWVANDGTDSSYSLVFYPATYFDYSGAGAAPTTVGAANNIAANYTKVEVKSTVASYTHANAGNRTDCSLSGTTATCTYAQEIQNFANWYTFYRSRILTARGGAGKAFALQGTGLRVGFATINKASSTVDGVATRKIVKGVRTFTGTDRSNWFTTFYGYTMPAAGTPLRQALDDVGQYFKRTDDAGPWGENPGSSGGTQWACRQNYNILMTDGYWNGSGAGTATGNIDNTAGSTKTRLDGSTYQYIARNPHSDSHSDTLADVAMYYWVNDLRSDMPNKVVPPNAKDPAFWQHLVNFTVGLGVYGTIPKSTIDAAFTAMNSVPLTPAPTSNMVMTSPVITWPTPCDTCTAKNVDDLAHAAINSRGNFFNAADPDQFTAALSDALDDIAARSGSSAAVAVANANITSGDNTSYASKYNSGDWTGNLDAFNLNVTTGIPDTTSFWNPTGADPGTTAQGKLDTRSAAAPTTWFTAANRYIATYSGSGSSSAGVQFQPNSATIGGAVSTKMSAAQDARFNTPPSGTDSTDVINYLRGDRSKETTYRSRSHMLGDIIDAEPVVVRKPDLHYVDSGYAAFKTSQISRFTDGTAVKTVFQGANDGMVHAFNGATGAENWAYVPNRLIAMADPTNSGTSVLNMLSRKTYSHRMYVDSTPFLGDVDFDNTDGAMTGTSNWKSLLVGGLGKGGRGVYALDVTTPNASSESDAASKVLWEFPNATTSSTDTANVGYVFGRPIIVKTKAKGWVVLVASGYNNGSVSGTDTSTGTGGDGKGYLFVLNARTGDVIKSISTTIGSATDPSGMAAISAFVENADFNNEVQQVYGGDLKGNVWRFDLSGTDSTKWHVNRLAILRQYSASPSTTDATQPITTEPQMSVITIAGGPKRFIYVGTGRYIGDTDVTTSQRQTTYALIDSCTSVSCPYAATPDITPVISDPVRNQLQVQTLTTPSSGTRSVSNNTVDFTTKKGWYLDLMAPSPSTDPAERINTNPALVSGALVFTSNIPSGDLCIPGGSSWLTILDYKTGGILAGSAGTFIPSTSLGNVLASRPVVIKTAEGLKALVRTSDSTTIKLELGIPSGSTAGKRAGWREISR